MNVRYASFLFVVCLTLGISSAHAAGLTHMGVFPAEHVTLRGVTAKGLLACFNNPEPEKCGVLFRTLPDGTTETNPFQIPQRMILVVTDLDWHYQGSTVEAAEKVGQHGIVRLQRYINVVSNDVLVSSAKLEQNCPTGLLSCVEAYANVQTTSGFVVFPEAKLRYDTFGLPFQPCDNPPCIEEAHIEVLVRGYLVPDTRRQ